MLRRRLLVGTGVVASGYFGYKLFGPKEEETDFAGIATSGVRRKIQRFNSLLDRGDNPKSVPTRAEQLKKIREAGPAPPIPEDDEEVKRCRLNRLAHARLLKEKYTARADDVPAKRQPLASRAAAHVQPPAEAHSASAAAPCAQPPAAYRAFDKLTHEQLPDADDDFLALLYDGSGVSSALEFNV